MATLGPLLLTIFVWWFATGVILLLDGLPRRTYRWTIGAATALTAAAFAGVVASAHDETASAAYAAFVCTVVVWGWNEVAFLMGGVTGSRRIACPPGSRGWQRFSLAFQALNYHEALIGACGLLIAVVTWHAPNKVALWTFLILWIMRASAKLNIFLGVPNITHEFLPAHLAYLKSYFRHRAMNALMPVSIGLGTLVTIALASAAAAAPEGGFDDAKLPLLASLLALAVVAHVFMVVPLPFGALWAWALRGSAPALPATVPALNETRVVPRAGGSR